MVAINFFCVSRFSNPCVYPSLRGVKSIRISNCFTRSCSVTYSVGSRGDEEEKMRYHMQRKEREITSEESLHSILRAGKFMVLALSYKDVPYTVALSYGYDEDENACYFHGAKIGRKMDYIRANSKACGIVIQDRGYVDGECSHAYRSVVVEGTMEIVRDKNKKSQALTKMFLHLEEHPENLIKRFEGDHDAISGVTILKLKIESLTGKQSKE